MRWSTTLNTYAVPNKLSFDPSQPLEVYFRVNRAWVNRRFIFKDVDGNDVDISSYDFELFFKQTEKSVDKVISLTIANGGLTLSGTNNNILTPHADENAMAIRPKNFYYGELYERTQKITWINCKGIAHQGEFDGVVQTESITVSLDGVDVIITIDATALGYGIDGGTWDTVYLPTQVIDGGGF